LPGCARQMYTETMKASVHVVASAALAGALYYETSSVAMAAACVVAGVLWDLDHIADYLVFSGEKFTVRDFFSWCDDNRWQRVTLLLHSYELYALLAFWTLLYGGPPAYGVLFGAGLHMLLDQTGNINTKVLRMSPWFYFLSFRIMSGFRKEKMTFVADTEISAKQAVARENL